MSERNYEIMSGDTLVAVWKNNRLDVINEALLPLYLRKIHNADIIVPIIYRLNDKTPRNVWCFVF